ncbi:hypothetical protein ACFLTU_03195 [Bacteroidota bacterium]
MERRIIIAILLFLNLAMSAQDLSTLRSKTLYAASDTIRLDTLPILPGSVFLFDAQQNSISDSLYLVLPSMGSLVLDPARIMGDITVKYRVLTTDIFLPYFHKDPSSLRIKPDGLPSNPFRISSEDLPRGNYYSYSELNKQGSLSRGISFGNSQDVVVNSNLNLQLTGKLSDNLNIIAAISDNNIPIQPEGYSQQISEFDKVYIEVFNDQLSLTGGDFELQGSPGMFTDFYKRAKGARFKGQFKLGNAEKDNFSTTISGAVSKGKFHRNSFTGIEGNQGPYKLQGANFEPYIVVLAGSERVYIDGRLLSRGMDRDYTIDYNNAEVTFTPMQPITKDKRIIVEFEYSEQSYARFLVYTSNVFYTEGGSYYLNVFSEQDDKNQSLRQDLSADEKEYLSEIGNDISRAVVPRIDSVGYNSDQVLYRKTDSLVNGNTYPDVYVQSSDPDRAIYRLRFSYVGEGRGNYLSRNSVVNGKVFQWQAPLNGQKQGSYEPVVLLVTPKKKQVVSFGGEQAFSSMTRASFELAMTNNDLNTFSSLGKGENHGYAMNLGIEQDMLRADTSRIRLRGSAGYRHINRNFNPVERFRSVEFERDWNLVDGMPGEHENVTSVGLEFYEKKAGFVNLNSEFLNRGSQFEGFRNALAGKLIFSGFELDLNGSLMNSKDSFSDTRFLRHRITLAKHFRHAILGVREEGENNQLSGKSSDSLTMNSFAFQEWEVFLTQPDSIQNRGFISYKNRKDYLPVNNRLEYATMGQDLSLGASLLKNPNMRLQTTLTYRELSISDTSLSLNRPEKTMTGRIEHGMHLGGGAISTSTFYEVGSGLETSREYSYLEVAPGQGVYQWIDYNQNGLKELDEFEIAQFKDEARYIRIFFPSSDFMTVYSNQFNQTINIMPARVWKSRDGLYKTISLFSEQFAYRINRKNTTNDILKNLIPIVGNLNDPDLITLSTSIRNNLSFNKTGKIFGADYIYQKNLNRSLLSNGFDTRTMTSHGLRGRISLGENISLINQFDSGDKTFSSQFLSTRDYDIDFIYNKLSAQIQLNMAFRLVADYGYKNQVNRLDVQQSDEHNLGTEFRYSILNKGIITWRMNYVHLRYNDDPNSPAGYEMLQGLMPGNNGTWTVLMQRSITGGIELNLEYSGRVSQNQAVIHTGGLQVRANF